MIPPTTSPTFEPTPDYYEESDDPDEETDDLDEETDDPDEESEETAEEPTDPEGPTGTAETAVPTASPKTSLTASPTISPTTNPTAELTAESTAKPSTAPTSSPTPAPSPRPSIAPSSSPSLPFIEREKNRLKSEEKEIERVAKNTTAEVMAGVIAVLSLIGMLFTAQQLLEKPDGLCASCCRCSLTFCTLCIKMCCLPCSLICGYKYNGYTGSDPSNKAVFLQAEEYTDDLELT